MRGRMLWFNGEKGVGFIQSDAEERIAVESTGFVDQPPAGRCAGRDVTFDLAVVDGEARAVNVVFPMESDPQRARRRRPAGGRSIWPGS